MDLFNLDDVKTGAGRLMADVKIPRLYLCTQSINVKSTFSVQTRFHIKYMYHTIHTRLPFPKSLISSAFFLHNNHNHSFA